MGKSLNQLVEAFTAAQAAQKTKRASARVRGLFTAAQAAQKFWKAVPWGNVTFTAAQAAQKLIFWAEAI